MRARLRSNSAFLPSSARPWFCRSMVVPASVAGGASSRSRTNAENEGAPAASADRRQRVNSSALARTSRRSLFRMARRVEATAVELRFFARPISLSGDMKPPCQASELGFAGATTPGRAGQRHRVYGHDRSPIASPLTPTGTNSGANVLLGYGGPLLPRPLSLTPARPNGRSRGLSIVAASTPSPIGSFVRAVEG
jgi:hypothetical protein